MRRVLFRHCEMLVLMIIMKLVKTGFVNYTGCLAREHVTPNSILQVLRVCGTLPRVSANLSQAAEGSECTQRFIHSSLEAPVFRSVKVLD